MAFSRASNNPSTIGSHTGTRVFMNCKTPPTACWALRCVIPAAFLTVSTSSAPSLEEKDTGKASGGGVATTTGMGWGTKLSRSLELLREDCDDDDADLWVRPGEPAEPLLWRVRSDKGPFAGDPGDPWADDPTEYLRGDVLGDERRVEAWDLGGEVRGCRCRE